MADEQKSLISLVPESVDGAVKNLTGPVTGGIGETLNDIWFLAFGGVHEAAEKKKLRIAAHLDQYKKELDAGVEAIPEENRQEPKLQTVGPALEKSKYCVEEKEIRTMFVKLITRSMDSRYNEKVHPSFPEIISQMSPLDAQNLSLFQKVDKYPVAEYQLRTAKNGRSVSFTNAFLENATMADQLELQASSLSSLSRLGLVTITYQNWLMREHAYDAFQSHRKYSECLAELNLFRQADINPFKEVYIQKGLVEITPLGKDFISICLAPNPS